MVYLLLFRYICTRESEKNFKIVPRGLLYSGASVGVDILANDLLDEWADHIRWLAHAYQGVGKGRPIKFVHKSLQWSMNTHIIVKI